MKVLSIKQPWAELILQGRKKIEIRKWNTQVRGEFLIHASKSSDKDSMKRFGFRGGELPYGFIIGKARIVGVKKYLNSEEFNRDKNLHLASEELGNFGFLLENVERIEQISAVGKLGFWDFSESGLSNKRGNLN